MITKEGKEFLYTFVDLGYAIEELLKDNERLEEENKRLRSENQKRFEMIMEGAKRSHESVKSFIKAIMDKEIIINSDGEDEED